MTGFKNHDYMSTASGLVMTDDAGAMIFLFGAIILPIVGVIALVLWMILHQREYSRKMKEEAKNGDGEKEDNSTKRHLVISIALIGGGWLLAQPWARETKIESVATVGIMSFLLGLIWFMFWLSANAANRPAKRKKT
jgi:flagellar biogenesis protein FliO